MEKMTHRLFSFVTLISPKQATPLTAEFPSEVKTTENKLIRKILGGEKQNKGILLCLSFLPCGSPVCFIN